MRSRLLWLFETDIGGLDLLPYKILTSEAEVEVEAEVKTEGRYR